MKALPLRDLVARHAVADGVTETPIEGLRLFRVSHPVERLPSVYPPSICCLAQGRKSAYLGGRAYTYDSEHYLCAPMPVPVEAEVHVGTSEEPVLGLFLDLDTRAMAETLIAYEAAPRPPESRRLEEQPSGLAVAKQDDGFATALAGLLELLDDPLALRMLGRGRLRELLFRILEGEAGPLVRRTLGNAQGINRVLTYVHENLGDPLSVDDLARRAGMSRAVFHRRFKAATSLSPLQFIKALRLSNAAMQIASGKAVSQAASAVGYSTASQFSREFRRQFGKSPREWAKAALASSPGGEAAGMRSLAQRP